MPDREKVIKGLEFCVNGHFKVELSLATKILALLKEQEADIAALKNAYKELAEKGEVVVRCKDCKYSLSNSRFCAYPHKKNNIQPCDWFCADGVKRDD